MVYDFKVYNPGAFAVLGFCLLFSYFKKFTSEIPLDLVSLKLQIKSYFQTQMSESFCREGMQSILPSHKLQSRGDAELNIHIQWILAKGDKCHFFSGTILLWFYIVILFSLLCLRCKKNRGKSLTALMTVLV